MVLNKEIVLIHGTWCDGNVWGEFATGLRQMGYKVHTPSFRYHDLPYQECLAKVGTVTLQDYRDDLVALIESLDQPFYAGDFGKKPCLRIKRSFSSIA